MPTDLEIERKYLLSDRPTIPDGVERMRIEQGYLAPAETAEAAELPEGRLRRITRADGSVTHVHTVKRGVGLVREETEQLIDRALFEAHWPRTDGARLCKTRFQTRIGSVLWVVDVFDDLDLVLAEAELPSADAPASPPPWVEPLIVREVTGDSRYSNAALARRLGAMRRGRPGG